jgi:GNAT superfamily N-acetyltransferase
VAELHLPWESHFTQQELSDHLARRSALAVRVAGSDEYAVGQWWQGRTEIGVLQEVMAVGHHQALALVERLLETLRAAGARLAILSQEEEQRALGFYRAHDWLKLEEILVYRRPQAAVPTDQGRLAFATLTPHRLPELMALEQVSFPWIWRYGSAFFQEAAVTPGRRLLLAYQQSTLIGYLIITLHGSFGHLDRLAVHPAFQHRGYGAELLRHALGEMTTRGATAAGLSTQKDNYRSQRLYESFGFRRTGKYCIYGKWIA